MDFLMVKIDFFSKKKYNVEKHVFNLKFCADM